MLGHVENLTWRKARFDQFPDHQVRNPLPYPLSKQIGRMLRLGVEKEPTGLSFQRSPRWFKGRNWFQNGSSNLQ
jgi:hypothetical protein